MIQDGTPDSMPDADVLPVHDRAQTDSAPLAAHAPHAEKKGSIFLWLVLGTLLFAAGVAASQWGSRYYQHNFAQDEAPETLAHTADTDAPANPAIGANPSADLANNPTQMLDARIGELSVRLDELNGQAQNASLYATRAESIMVAFAARRSLDSGLALGYLENELQYRFGDEQPRAVATILSAAREPVTLMDLQAGLAALAPQLTDQSPTGDWWTAAKREIANIVIIRRMNSPSPAPRKALEDARVLLASGRVADALIAVEKIPGHSDADGWMEKARRYNEARRALDLIEAAAILKPRTTISPAALVSAPAPAAALSKVAAIPSAPSASSAPANSPALPSGE